jgi:hypothetical protein
MVLRHFYDTNSWALLTRIQEDIDFLLLCLDFKWKSGAKVKGKSKAIPVTGREGP